MNAVTYRLDNIANSVNCFHNPDKLSSMLDVPFKSAALIICQKIIICVDYRSIFTVIANIVLLSHKKRKHIFKTYCGAARKVD